MNRLIFALKDGVQATGIFNAPQGSTREYRIERLHDTRTHVDALKRNNGISTEGLTDDALFESKVYPNLPEAEKELYRTYIMELNSKEEQDNMMAYLEAHEGVVFVQKDELNELYSFPNDPLLGDQWAIAKMECKKAWQLSQGDDIIVAIVDTGVDAAHPDMSQNLWRNAQGKFGYDFSDDNDNPSDYQGHGSHCAGIVAAVTDNAAGIAGVAPKAKIMSVKIFPNAYDSVCAKAIKYAADNGARVISNSWGPTGRRPSNPLLESTVDYAYSKGCIVVFAAGNSNDDVKYYSPANYHRVISVAATDVNDKRASFSNYGSLVTVAAPGVRILSLEFNTQGYVNMSGTSMACPQVAGVAALILMRNSDCSFEDVKYFISNFGDAINTDKPISKRVNAHASVRHAIASREFANSLKENADSI